MPSLHPFASQEALFGTRGRPAGRRLLFGRLELFADRLVLRGLGLRGRYARTIPLRAVERVEWTHGRGANLVLFLAGEGPLPLVVRAAGLWTFTLRAHRPSLRTARPGMTSAA